jgi:hypothetical protein
MIKRRIRCLMIPFECEDALRIEKIFKLCVGLHNRLMRHKLWDVRGQQDEDWVEHRIINPAALEVSLTAAELRGPPTLGTMVYREDVVTVGHPLEGDEVMRVAPGQKVLHRAAQERLMAHYRFAQGRNELQWLAPLRR